MATDAITPPAEADTRTAPDDGLRYLARGTLEDLGLATAAMVERIEVLIRARQAGTAWNAPKSAIHPGAGRLFMSMLAVAEDPPFAAIKALGLNPANPAAGLPTIGSTITLFDSRTGLPLAVMDGDWITGVRTAALSAVAATHLARPDAAAIAFIGCGVQARSHLGAFKALFPLREVRAFGRGAVNRDALCQQAESLGLAAIPSASAEAAVTGADLVVTSVPHAPGQAPFLDPAWLAPGAFVASTDHARPWLTDSLAALDRRVIDDAEQEAAMVDPMLAPALISGDLSDLLTGKLPPRRDTAERVMFVFRGLALGDLALASLAYEAAVASDRGCRLAR